MALPVLDGNQSATTLSSVVTGGEHIVAHSVVCLGSTAIANITNAVSGSVVSVSNFPASQSTTFGAVTGSVSVLNFPSTQTIEGTVTANVAGQYFDFTSGDTAQLVNPVYYDGEIVRVTPNLPLPVTLRPAPYGQTTITVSGTVTVGNSVTIGSLPAISGTVTANVLGYDPYNGAYPQIPVHQAIEGFTSNDKAIPVIIGTDLGVIDSLSNPLPISGTITVSNSVTIGSLPAISGTVTAAAPNGSLTTRFGTPTTANTAFATSAVTNANRKYLLIQNVTTGSNVITVGIGFTPTTTQGIQLTAGAGITFESSYIPTGAVYVLSSVTASNFTILEA